MCARQWVLNFRRKLAYMDNVPPPESINDLILRMTDEAWSRHEGVLLARIGDEIRRLPPELTRAELRGRKLAQFIREELGHKISLHTFGEGEVVRLALPMKVGADIHAGREYVPKSAPNRKAAAASGVTGAVRLAFSRELEPGKQRVMHLSPKPRFEDIEDGAPVPPGAALIDRSLVVAEGAADEEHLRKILTNISAWREQLGVGVEVISTSTKTDEQVSRSLLDLMLGQLTDVERKRVQLPLDIVAKLRNATVK